MASALLLLGLCACEREEPAVEFTATDNEAERSEVVPVRTATLKVGETGDVGPYLTDGAGRALYVLEGSRGGEPNCDGACLEAWPPMLTDGAPQAAAPSIDQGKLGTSARNGGEQVTYAGWKLFYYRGDRDPGQVSGQDMHDQWGEWYLLSPAGEPIESEGPVTSPL